MFSSISETLCASAVFCDGMAIYSTYQDIKTYVRKYSFSQRSINIWNKLSTDCVRASSFNVFKNRIESVSLWRVTLRIREGNT